MTKKRIRKTPEGYRSKAEGNFAKYLKAHKIKFLYEPEKFKYWQPETPRTYLPDFKIKDQLFIEFKGRFTASDRKKMLLVKDQWPEYEFRLVFMQDNPITKTSKTRYSDWAEKNGFKYHVGISLPQAWIKEFRDK